MKTLIIGFSRPTTFKLLSWLIQKIEKTEYSHVYAKFYSSTINRQIIYQASGLEVNFVGSELFYKNHIAVKEFSISVSDEVYLETMRFAVDSAGMPYSIKQLFGILFYMLTGKVPVGDGRRGYVCSELMGQMLTQKLEKSVTKDLDLVLPKDIYNLLDK